MEFLNNVKEFFINFVNIAGPVVIILFNLAILVGIIKWSYKTKDWLKIVSKNPILLLIWILVSLIGIYFLYKYFPAVR